MVKYPEAVNLPFNGVVIREGFVPRVPSGDPFPGEGIWLVVRGNALVVEETPEGYRLPTGGRPDWLEPEQDPLCIGYWHGEPLLAVRHPSRSPIPEPFRGEAFNSVEDRLDDRLLTLGGMANQILQWQVKSRRCSRCGEPTDPIPGTWGVRCGVCKLEHFPPIHPCIIVLVKRGDEFLLTRKADWPAGRYSLVAGFLDFGESLEECVAREVLEETGIRISGLRYVGSQNWPFPSQLMAGFVADYAGGELTIDAEELEDARWFTTDRLPPSLPSRRSIARWIIDRYALGNSAGTEE